MGYGPCLSDYTPKENQNSNPKKSPGGKSENTFRSEVSNDKIPYYKRKKLKRLNDLDKYLIFAFVSLILFTIAVLVIFAFTGTEPAVLIGCFFAAFGGEILMCALIKKLKLHKEVKEKNNVET